MGTVLGERKFFNMPPKWPSASFRIATPLALLLFIPRCGEFISRITQHGYAWLGCIYNCIGTNRLLSAHKRQSFNGVLENYPSEQQRFRLVKESNKTDGGAAKREHDAASLSGLEPGSCLVAP